MNVERRSGGDRRRKVQIDFPDHFRLVEELLEVFDRDGNRLAALALGLMLRCWTLPYACKRALLNGSCCTVDAVDACQTKRAA